MRIWLFFFPILMANWVFGPTITNSQASSPTTKDSIVQHLEFLGYECKQLNQGIKVTHDSKLGFLIVILKDGLMAQSAFAGIQTKSSSKAKNKADGARFSEINQLNAQSTISRFFWSSSGELVMRASMLGHYDKNRFYTFMEAWEKDGETLGGNYAKLKRFLK